MESKPQKESKREIERERARERAENEPERTRETNAEGERLMIKDIATESGTHSMEIWGSLSHPAR